MRNFLMAIVLVVGVATMACNPGPACTAPELTDASIVDASTINAEVVTCTDPCSDEAWELQNWALVLDGMLVAGDWTDADLEWLNNQMQYAAGVFRVCVENSF